MIERALRDPAAGSQERDCGQQCGDAERLDEVILIPVKGFSCAKVRLAPALSGLQRATLARRMADAVVSAAAPIPVVVVCDDEDVADWATKRGARVEWRPGTGLNAAVQSASWEIALTGSKRVTVVHADIPEATGLATIGSTSGAGQAVLVPDRRRDGTNLISLPGTALQPPGDPAGFTFSYGPASFARHLAEAVRLDLNPMVVGDTPLSIDIDIPDDLLLMQR